MARWGDRPDLTPAQQYLFLMNSLGGHGAGSLAATGLTWRYKQRPTPLSREYTVRIQYERGGVPEVFVEDPDITALAAGRDIPHVYKNPLLLCLYLPRSGEWEGTMRIDRTFIPWTAVWLYYFEEWLASDDWKGGGVHPGEYQDPNPNRRQRRAARRHS
jgi:hypothetical protein